MTARSYVRCLRFGVVSGFSLTLLSAAAQATPAVAPSVGVGWGDLAGPLGGALAAAFAGGAIAGYGFCVRTILKISNGRIATLEETVKDSEKQCQIRISRLEWRLDREQRRNRQLTDMLMGRRAVGKFSADLEDEAMPPDEEIDRQMSGLNNEA